MRAAEIVAELETLVHVVAGAVVAVGTLRNGVAHGAGAVGRSFRVDARVRAAETVRQTFVDVEAGFTVVGQFPSAGAVAISRS